MPGGSGRDMFGQPGHKMWPVRRRFRHGAALIVGFVVLAGAATGLMLFPSPVQEPPIGGALSENRSSLEDALLLSSFR
jgi:hypothetical protein